MLQIVRDGCCAAKAGRVAAMDHAGVDGTGMRSVSVGGFAVAQRGSARVRVGQPGGNAVGDGGAPAVSAAIPFE